MSTQTKPSDAAPEDDFTRWQKKFDVALERPERLKAWRTLIDHGCDPRALKSALYYAAYHLSGAQECPREWGAYARVRKTIFNQLSELRESLRELSSLIVGRERIVSFLLSFYGVKKEYVIFFKKFPKLLGRLEMVLMVLLLPPEKRNQLRAMLIASGEALLHIYVEEATGRLFPAEAAVLLQAGAASYLLDRGPIYSAEAVSKRYQRYRKQEGEKKFDLDKATRLLVRQFRSEAPDIVLHKFINMRMVELFFDPVRDYLDSLP